MKLYNIYIVIITIIIPWGCSSYNFIDEQIIDNLQKIDIGIEESSLKTYKFNVPELEQLYPDFEFYKSSINTIYLEYPKLELISLYNRSNDKLFLLHSMSFKTMDPVFLYQFENRKYESDKLKIDLINGFYRLYKELEDECKLNIIDKTNYNNIKFEILNNENITETYYLTYKNNILVDFNIDFKAIPIH